MDIAVTLIIQGLAFFVVVLVVMRFGWPYIIGPIEGLGSVKEPLMAVGIAIAWGLYGLYYFVRNSKKRGKATLTVKTA